jgi:CBS domain-containing protein
MTVEELLRSELLRHVQLSQARCVQSGTSLDESLQVMRSGGVSALLVCQGERPIGIFTERDVLNKLLGGNVDGAQPIDRLMTPSPKTLSLDDTLGEAVHLMTEHGYRHLPLVDEHGGRAGLIAALDIMRYVAEHFPAEVVNLPPSPNQEFTAPEGG